MRTKILSAALSVVLLPMALRAQLPNAYYYDDSFASNWLTEYTGFFQDSVTYRESPPIVGGSGYLYTQVVGNPPITYRAYHYWTKAIYVPITNGPIASLHWQAHFQAIVGGHIVNLVALQNNTVYMSPQGESASSQGSWLPLNAIINPATFVRVLGDGPATLDFSACGAPIIFGYVNYNDSGIRADGPGCPHGGCLLNDGEFGLALYTLTVIPEQRFKFKAATQDSPTTMTFSWETVYGYRYALEYSDNLAASWTPILTNQASSCSSSLTIRTDILPRAYFRVRRL